MRLKLSRKYSSIVPKGVAFSLLAISLSGCNAESFGLLGTTSSSSSGSNSTTTEETKTVFVTIPAPPLSLVTLGLLNGTKQSPFQQAVVVSGGTAPYVFSISSGALPAGLTLDTQTGLISGTPTVSGSFAVGIRVRDSATPVATANKVFSLIVNPALSPTINNATLPNGQVGAPYSQAVLVSQGVPPYTFSLPAFPGGTGLPAGLSLSGTTGSISGTPTAGGTSLFQVLVTDAAGGTATQLYTVQITSTSFQALAFGNTSFLPVSSGTNEVRSITVNGGAPPYTLSVISGSIPAGMTFTNGVISGIPSQSSGLPATSNFRVQLQDQQNTILTQDYSLKVVAPLQITSNPTLNAFQNVIFTTNLAASGGSGSYTFSQTGLPNTGTATFTVLADGSMIGIATVAPGASYNFNLRVTDSDGLTFTKAMVLNIGQPLALTATSLPAAAVGRSYLTSGGGAVSVGGVGGLGSLTYSIASGALPQGLTLNPSNGVIAGTPAPGINVRTGSFPITVQVTDIPYGNSTVSKDFTLSVMIPPRILSDVNYKFRPAAAGQPGSYVYSEPLRVEGGFGNLTYSATNLPPGLSMHSSGVVLGTPTGSANTYLVNFTVTDANGNSDTKQKKMRVVGAAKTAAFDRPVGQRFTTYQHHLRVFDVGYLNDDAYLDVATHYWSMNPSMLGFGLGNGKGNFGGSVPTELADNRFVSHCPTQLAIHKMHEGDNANDVLTIFRGCNAQGMVIFKGNTASDPTTWATNFQASARQRFDFAGYGLAHPLQFNFGRVHVGAPNLDDMVLSTDQATQLNVVLNCGNQNSVLLSDNTTSLDCTNNNYQVSYSEYSSQIFKFRVIPISTAPHATWGVGLVDLNNDGIRDLVYTTFTGGEKLFVMLGRSGTPLANPNESNALTLPFDPPVQVPLPWSGANFQEGGGRITAQDILGNNLDFNSDNKPDIVVNSIQGATIFFGNGTGGFGSTSVIANSDLGSGGYIARVGELNGDGCLDVVTTWVGQGARNNLQVWYNQKSGATCTGTFSRTTGRHLLYSGWLPYDLALGKLFNPNYPANPPTDSLDLFSNASELAFTHLSTWANSGSSSMPFRGGLAAVNNPASGTGPSFYTRGPNVDETSYGPPIMGDINGDQYPDVVVKGNGGAGVFLGGAGGTLTIQNSNILTMGNYEWWMQRQQILTDLNGDGILDYLSGNYNSSTVGVNLGVGDGTFNPLVSLTIGLDLGGLSYPRSIAIGDLNKDGKADLVVGSYINGSGRISIHPGLGDGTFSTNVTAINTGANNWVNHVALADVNRDGNLDMIATDDRGPLAIMIYIANGSNFGFAAPSAGAGTFLQISGFGTNTVQGLDVQDVNSDGWPDIAISGLQNSYYSIILGNNGAYSSLGVITQPQTTVGGQLNSIRFADWDDDGYLDLLLAKDGNGIYFYRNTKDSSVFSTTPTSGPYVMGNQVFHTSFLMINTGDLNGDDLPDILSSGETWGFGVSYNQSY